MDDLMEEEDKGRGGGSRWMLALMGFSGCAG